MYIGLTGGRYTGPRIMGHHGGWPIAPSEQIAVRWDHAKRRRRKSRGVSDRRGRHRLRASIHLTIWFLSNDHPPKKIHDIVKNPLTNSRYRDIM